MASAAHFVHRAFPTTVAVVVVVHVNVAVAFPI
jgi:hypothetical protein